MRRHSVISLVAVGTVAALGIAATPAGAASATPVKGTATSALSLLQIKVGNQLIEAVNALGSTGTVAGNVANIALTPINVAGTKYGATTVTPAQGSRTIAAPSAPALPGGLAQIASPVLQVVAGLPVTGPITTLGATDLGSAKILGLPLSLNGSLAQQATTGESAVGTTGLKLTNLALPSVGDLLGALGLDLKALPVSTLDALVNKLNLGAPGLNAANHAVTTAQAAANSTIDRLRSAQALVAGNSAALNSATAALASATAALDGALATVAGPVLTLAGLGSVPSAAAFSALAPAVKSILTTAVPSLTALDTAFTAAKTVVNTATAAVTSALSLVSALGNLGDLIKGVLSSVPLASIGSLDISAVASAGKSLVANVTGSVSGVKVLGTDVVKSLTGVTGIDALAVVGTLASQLQGKVDNVARTLDGILSTVPGVSGLNPPLPQIKVLDITKSVQTLANGQQFADAAVTALKVSIAGFSIPSAVALPGAASLPGLSAITGGVLNSPLSVLVGTVAEHATFIPAGTSSNPTVVGGSTSTGTKTGLASTGGKTGTAIAALALLVLGFGVRRAIRVASRG